MLRHQPFIISDRTNIPASLVQAGDWHDVIGHHRYYGSSAIAGEPIAESRRGPCAHAVNVCGF
jgi:hypothetical protein